LEVRKAISGLRSAAAQIDAANESLLLSERELEQAKRRFEGGVATGLEVTDAQARLARAREARLDASYVHRFAAIDLALATGRAQEAGN
jgi:outer membrane protein